MLAYRKTLLLVIALVAAGVLAGCESQQGEAPPEEPPPPSPEEIRQASSAVAQALRSRKQNESLDEFGARLVNEVRQFKQRYGTTETGQQEIISLTKRFIDSMQQEIDRTHWKSAEILNNCVLALSPSNSRALRARDKIQQELSKPKLRLTMFTRFREEEKVYVGFEVTLPDTEEKVQVNVEVGDEFYGYKLKRIIGNNQGVKLEYLPTRTFLTLMLHEE